MEEQQYILRNQKSFKLKDIFECGQCFRWNEQEDGSYLGMFKENILNVTQKDNKIIFRGICKNNIKETVEEYFDLKRDYEKIKKTLIKTDTYMQKAIKSGEGIRILNQDLWETIISFIISANNNIPRIKKIIEKISEKYGKELCYNGKKYYAFPTPEELKDVTISDFRNLGLGFRDVRLYETTKMIIEKQIDLEKLHLEKDTQNVREQLLTLAGVGPKVADCILLFSTLKRFDVFPIDVWVRRVMNELYIHGIDETKVNKKEIESIAKEKFGDLEGIAQQYLFYWRRGE